MNNIIKPVNQLMFYAKNLHIKPFEYIHVRDYRYSKPCCHKSGWSMKKKSLSSCATSLTSAATRFP